MLNVKSYYIDINYNYKNIDNVFFHEQIEKNFRNIKKIQNNFERIFKLFITKNVFDFIINVFYFFINYKINYIAIFCLIFADFFRFEKFIYESQNYYDYNFFKFYMIKRSILFDFNNFLIHLFVFKIDFFKLKIDIHIAIINKKNCSFMIMKNFYKMIFQNFDNFLFEINNKFFKRIIIFTFVQIFTILNLNYTFKFVDFLFKINVVIFVKQTSLFKQKM